jgi:BON domain
MFRRKHLLTTVCVGLLCMACSKPSDDSITTSIKASMYSAASLKSSSVDVSTKDGVVTLTGQTSDDAARLAAEQIATKTPGVKTVVDRTTMASPAPSFAENVAPPAPKPEKRPEKPAREPRKPAPPPPAAIPAPVTAPPVSDTETNPVPLNNAADNRPSAPAPAPPPPPPPPKPVVVTIPENSIVTIRTIDPIDSSVNHPGQIFRASLDAPIVVGDQVVVPKGLNAYIKLTDASSAGKFKGRSELTVELNSFTYQGKTYELASSNVQQTGSSRGKRSAGVIGGSTVLGALIGGIAGGGKGAAIGAAAGAGTGTAVQALTHGEQVKIPSETRLDFTLRDPVTVSYFPRKSAAVPPSQPAPPPPAPSPDATQPAQPQQPPPQ